LNDDAELERLLKQFDEFVSNADPRLGIGTGQGNPASVEGPSDATIPPGNSAARRPPPSDQTPVLTRDRRQPSPQPKKKRTALKAAALVSVLLAAYAFGIGMSSNSTVKPQATSTPRPSGLPSPTPPKRPQTFLQYVMQEPTDGLSTTHTQAGSKGSTGAAEPAHQKVRTFLDRLLDTFLGRRP
jgi:hypothetical protein